MEEIDLEQVANHCAMSMYHFHRIFQQVSGMSVAEYIRKRRLTYAAKQLVETDIRIIEIAFMFHFSSQEAFTRAFKAMFHLTPKKYRTFFRTFYMEEERVMEEQTGYQQGWIESGSHPDDYTIGIDKETAHQGRASAYIKSNGSEAYGFATYMQMFRAHTHRGKRLRMSAFLKTEEAKTGATLWMRVDDKQGEVLQFDNMETRKVRGATEWNTYSVVLDIPEESECIVFGVMLQGPGHVWADSFRFDEVDDKVPTTNILETMMDNLLDEPINLSFDE
ncbi:AraC-like DNA-binding protein [Priestia taiwanensis]|nr:AraC-like DNA-binding protein [Priestia taiwanensis]